MVMAPRQIEETDLGVKILIDRVDAQVDILAIHGRGAHPRNTWSQPRDKDDRSKGYIDWLSDETMLPAVVPSARVMRYGYRSDWYGKDALNTSPRQICEDLLRLLTRKRSSCDRRPLIIIAHSFGGVLTMELLVTARTQHPELFESVTGLIFFGTPFRGNGTYPRETLIAMAYEAERRSYDSGYKIYSKQLEDIDAGNTYLEKIFASFKQGLRDVVKPKIVCIYEQDETNIAVIGDKELRSARWQNVLMKRLQNRKKEKLVLWVNEQSATLDIIDSAIESRPRACHHLNLNKYRNADSQDFKELATVLVAMVEQGPSLLTERHNELYPTPGKETEDLVVVSRPRHPIDREHELLQNRLQFVSGAFYDDYTNGEIVTCLQNTRTDVLQKISEWQDNPDGKMIFWLCGKAGAGKSTIARTCCQSAAHKGSLGASFFFRRGGGARSNAKLFFSTLVKQLLDHVPNISRRVADVLETNPLICEKSPQQQFQELLLTPFTVDVQQGPRQRLLIVVDALDECDTDLEIRNILRLLPRVNAINLQLQIFVTSRPELPIRLGFQEADQSLHEDVILEEIQKFSIEQDIRLYFRHRFEQMQKDMVTRYNSPPAGWPGDDSIEMLVTLAIPLFIFAATVCRTIERSPSQLDVLLRNKDTSLCSLEDLYGTILNSQLHDRNVQLCQQILANFQIIVGSIIVVFEPLSAASLVELLATNLDIIDDTLQSLHSVLRVPESPTGVIEIHHQSFRDFLVSTGTVSQFHVDEAQTHGRLASQCIERLHALKKDICRVGKPGIRRTEIEKHRVTDCIPPDTEYACRHWIAHIMQSEQALLDTGRIYNFLQHHFLHWLEALAWLGRSSDAVASVTNLKSSVRNNGDAELSAFLDDALRFVLMNRESMDLAPLQLYHSALIFTPASSMVRNTFRTDTTAKFDLLPDVASTWSAERQRLEGHRGFVNAVAFSHDGKLASASEDKTVRVWDADTGEERWKLKGHDGPVKAVTFSHDGKLASGSSDKTVRMWDAETGEETRKLSGHDGQVKAVMFSPSGKLLVSASLSFSNYTVRVFDAENGEERQKLEGLDSGVRAVTFSPNAKLLAYAYATRSLHVSVRVRDIETGEERRKLDWLDSHVSAVTFSPDGKLLASAFENGKVRIRDTETNGEQWKLEIEGYDSSIKAVTFSPDGKLLASASDDRTARVWDVETGEERQKLEHEAMINAVAFSHDGKLLASASHDQTVRVWNVEIGGTRRKVQVHDGEVSVMSFSPDGKLLASAADDDETVRVWDVRTGQEIQKVKHEAMIKAVAFSHDDKLLALASINDNTVRVWDVETGEERHKLEGHNAGAHALAFSHGDGKMLASASYDTTILVWDAETGKKKQRIELGFRIIDELHFSADDRCICTNRGDFSLGPGDAYQEQISTDAPAAAPQSPALSLHREWIRLENEDLLWLPHEYRGECLAARDNTLVIGQKSGAVSFFRVKTDASVESAV